jgi:pyruvate dehydrogenase E2 component (dihydrolipoamide acetyltransferase)
VRGTGYEGRVVAADVLEFKGVPAQAAAATASAVQEDAFGYYEDIPNSNMRKVIGKRLLESKTTIPHYYLTIELNMDKLLKYVCSCFVLFI